MGDIYNLILFEPLLNGLVFIYRFIPDLGVAIILLTIVIKIILYIPSRSSIRSQKKLQETQPKLQEIQKKYKNDKEELGRQMMKFYKENKVNPFSSCLPLLIQLPILIALYRVFLAVAQTDPATHILIIDQLEHLYAPLRDIFTTQPIHPTFIGLFDLSQKGNYLFAILAGAAQFWQTKMLMAKRPPKVPGAKDEGMTAGLNKQMTYFMPIITVFFGIQFPAGLTLYWLVSTLFSVAQQYYIFSKDKTKSQIVESHEVK
ncbi:YidC/Oxa1 family membrane protein insertase [Patescibacteria group bacterium]|nr:YidC/Oxa1 family membrane protein insertase [Patescibacteria group bacterium]